MDARILLGARCFAVQALVELESAFETATGAAPSGHGVWVWGPNVGDSTSRTLVGGAGRRLHVLLAIGIDDDGTKGKRCGGIVIDLRRRAVQEEWRNKNDERTRIDA